MERGWIMSGDTDRNGGWSPGRPAGARVIELAVSAVVPVAAPRAVRRLRGASAGAVASLARGLIGFSALPGSWCPMVAVIDRDGSSAWLAVVGAGGFALCLGAGLALAAWSAVLAGREDDARAASWSALAGRTAAVRQAVEARTRRLELVAQGASCPSGGARG